MLGNVVAPARERGLKFTEKRVKRTAVDVAPARERGLKSATIAAMIRHVKSSLPRGSVD